MLTCEHCREELPEYALGHADPAAAAAVDEHLAACVVCRRELAEVESAWSAIALALPPAAPRPEVFDRIVERIETAIGAAPHLAVRSTANAAASPLTPRQRVLSYVVAASVFFALVGGSLYMKYAGPGAAPADQLADQALRDLAQRLGNLQQLERMLNTGNVKLASLTPANSRDHASAYVVWDYPNKQWHFYALGLPPAPAGQTYQLWAVAGDSAPLAGPPFTVGADGVGGTVADFPTLAPRTAVKAVVTLEPAGGSKAPTGDPLLEASL
jgi:anti-sigma-K factor RskA